MSPGTEFARDFCAGIGPLQLGVVLVSIYFKGDKKLLNANEFLQGLAFDFFYLKRSFLGYHTKVLWSENIITIGLDN